MIKYDADPLQYKIISCLGQGYTSFFIAKHLRTGNHVALRRTDLDTVRSIAYLQQEIVMSRQLRHENILPFLCSFVVHNELWVIMPLFTHGSIKDIMVAYYPTGLPELAIAFILRDVLSGLVYLHSQGIIHRSVKASHILVSDQGRAVLTGLRHSGSTVQNCRWCPTIHSFPQDSIANLNWLSPELLEQNLQGYSYKADLYSIGIVACELANGFEPFADLCPTQMILEKLQGYIPQPIDARCYEDTLEDLPQLQERATYQQRLFSQNFHYFTQLCLQKNPIHRPSASQLKSHAFIKQCKKRPWPLLQLLTQVSLHKVQLAPENQDSESAASTEPDQPTWAF